jgi:hypothetical protein
MGDSVFIIEELNPYGGKEPPEGFARFEWTVANKNMPLQPWSFGIHQRTVRTDYPGADDPTEQVLGPNYTPFTLNGRWDNRYNQESRISPTVTDAQRRQLGSEYAKREREKFENLVRRGNPVRITFGDLTVQGIITDCVFEYRRTWDIGYSFTVSPHHRQPGGFFALKRSPRTALSATQLRKEVSSHVDTMTAYHAGAPQERLVLYLYPDVDAKMDEIVERLAIVDQAIEQRNLTPEVEPNTGLLRVASEFLAMSSLSQELIDILKGYSANEALDAELAMATLDFEVWARGLMATARLLVISATRAASDLQQRAKPNALALYRPYAGEHLYSVSNRFYKTPHMWREIMRRNGLTTTSLTGEELLIIPEAVRR